MEIERLVSGELSKSIEQAAALLGDLERKMAGLKAEFVQTVAAAGIRPPATLANPGVYGQGVYGQGLYGHVSPFGLQGMVNPFAQGGFPPFVGQQPLTPFGAPFATPFGVPQQFGVGINPTIGQGFGVGIQGQHPLAQQAWLSSPWAREALLRQSLAVPQAQSFGTVPSFGQALTTVPQFQQGITPQQYGYIW